MAKVASPKYIYTTFRIKDFGSEIGFLDKYYAPASATNAVLPCPKSQDFLSLNLLIIICKLGVLGFSFIYKY